MKNSLTLVCPWLKCDLCNEHSKTPAPDSIAMRTCSYGCISHILRACHHLCNATVSILITESIISSTLAATGAATDVATTSLIMAPTRYQEARGDQNLRERKLHSCLVRRLCQDGGERFVAKLGAWEEIVFSFASSMRREFSIQLRLSENPASTVFLE